MPVSSICSGPITSTINAMRCGEIFSHASAKKETERFTGLKFPIFTGRFRVAYGSEGVKMVSGDSHLLF